MSHPCCFTILLIDNCAEDREAFCRFLQQDSLYIYHIVECETATQAMKWCQQEIPDIIVLDFLLPDGDGLKFIEQFRKCHSKAETDVIMLTGRGDEATAVRAMKSGVQDYLVKDQLKVEVLQGAIHHAVERIHLTRQLEQSQQQQQLIASIALRIRQSLQLEEILSETATQVRQFLQADRVLVYQFQPDRSGIIVAESVLPGWTVTAGRRIRDTCLQQQAINSYCQLTKRVINDIYQADLTNCHIKLLEQFEVQANLVVPILVSEQLWGLLIAHQCSASRHWQSVELDLLDQLAVQIAIAIQQASAYQRLQVELAERKQAELALQQLNQQLETKVEQRTAALRDSERRYATLAEAAPVAILRLDSTAQCIYANDYWSKMTGRPTQIALGMGWLQTLHPEDRNYLLRQSFQGWQTRQEGRYLHPDGSIVWFYLQVLPETNPFGMTIGYIATLTDITEHKKAEEALRESEHRYATLAQAAPVGIFRLDMVGNCVYVNDYWSEMTGRPTQAALGRGWVEAVYPEDRDRILREWNQADFETTEIFCNEGRHLRPDGSINWFCCYVLRETNPSGQIIGYVGTLTDITERKQAEAELIRNRDLREAIFNESADAMFLVDPQTLLTLDCNRRAVELFEAADKTELVNINGQTLQRRMFTASETDAIVADMHSQGFWSREIEYVTLKSKFFWGNIAAKPITVAGRTMNIVRITDISDRKKAEEELRQTNKQLVNTNIELAQATRLKDEFLANMSHELRTPLNAILGMSEGLQESAFGSINERQVKAIATIERSGRHLLELINDILDLSKIESGKLELHLSDVSVRSLCDASLAFVKQMALKQNIRLHTQIYGNIDSIQVDDRRLRQVLINLLSNAVKFTPEGGSVSLEVRLEELGEQGCRGAEVQGCRGAEVQGCRGAEVQGCRGAGEVNSSSTNLCFYVTDTGIGIAPENIGKLFQPFTQLDSSLNRQYSGTGLGLALVQRIATLHGGTVSVSSEVGKGSCFSICIPYHTSQNLSTTQVTLTLPSHRLPVGNTQVLIIEDSVAAADHITRYFSEMGMQPMIYPQGEGALEEVLRLQPAVVILDLQLPNLSGWDVLHQLKTHPKTKDIPVIIISVLDEHTKGIAQGAFAYLVKPITRAQLQATIDKLQNAACFEDRRPIIPQDAAVNKPLILLAEDNQANIDTMSGYLESRGYDLILANNGQQAIELVKVQRPDLIVMDIQMPGMDGLEAMRRIREHRQFVDIPMIALTALAMPGDRETCLAAGANEYLTKPVKLKQLVATIQQLLEKK